MGKRKIAQKHNKKKDTKILFFVWTRSICTKIEQNIVS